MRSSPQVRPLLSLPIGWLHQRGTGDPQPLWFGSILLLGIFKGYGSGILERNLMLLEFLCLAFVIGIVLTMWKLAREVKASRLAEEARRDSERRLVEAQRIAQMGNWELDLGNNVLTWSDEIYRIFEIDPEKFGASYEAFLNAVHPDDRDLVNKAYTDSVKNKAPYDIVHRLQMPDGRIKYVNEKGATHYGGDNKPLRSTGTVHDITERRLAEEQKELYFTFFMLASDGMCIADPFGCFKEVNPAFLKLTGYSAEELVSKPFLDFVLPEDRQKTAKEMELQVNSRPSINFENHYVRKDGQVITLSWTAFFNREDGATYATARDITDRMQATEALRSSETRFRSLVTAISELVWTTDSEGQVSDDIPTWQAYTGQTREEVRGSGWSEALHPDDMAPTLAVWQQAVTSRSSYQAKYRIRRHDGQYRYFSARGVPVLDANGAIREWVGLCTDIHDSKLAEEKIRHLASIVESSDDAIIGKTLDEQIISWNKGAERIYGFTAGEIVGQSVSMVVPPGLREELAALMTKLKRGESVDHFETTRVRKDGQLIHVSLTISPIRDSLGQIIAASTIAREITDRKRAEEEIRKFSRYTRSLIEASLDPLVTISPSGKITDVNVSTETATGRTRAELIGTDFSSYFTEPEKARAGYEQVFREGSVRDYPLELRHRRGDVTPVLYNATVYRDESGQVTGVFAAARDISERKRAEDELQNLNQELEQRVSDRTAQLELANKELEAFAYSVSHDLRTPLRSIDGFSRILQEDYADELDENAKEHLATIRAASQRMALLIDDILQLSRITRTPLHMLPVDLSALAASVARELKKVEPDRLVEFDIEPGCVEFADGNLMRIVLENLLGNAWKFTAKQRPAKIAFGRTIHEGTPVYFVRDNGVGFDMQYASKLFGAFQRLHTSDEFPGTGIGLASVQRIIHRHGGSVRIEGKPGGGATAYFTIQQPESIP